MNAISLYVSASRLLFQCESDAPNYSDLYRLVPYLRQSLSCTVCANLLVEPYSPQDVCQHHVCRTCVGGRKNLKPTCSSCRNYHTYQPNIQLRILLQCYKALCNYILGTPLIYSSMHKYVHVDGFTNGNNDAHNLAELIDEGARFHDDYKSSSGLPKSAFSILPCIFTTTSQSNHQTNTSTMSMAHMNAKLATTSVQTSTPAISAIQMVSKATTTALGTTINAAQKLMEPMDTVTVMANTSLLPNPPIKTVSNGTALYSVMYAGTGNKITIKRKTDDSYFNNTKTLSAKETKEMLDFLSGTTSTSCSSQSSTSNSVQNQQQSLQLYQARPTIMHTSQSQLQSHNLVTSMPQIIQQQSQIQNFKKPTMSKTKLLQKRKGCRCGNATPTPGKLTCCGQRCPCYVDSKSCIDCKCRGCRNPHRIDGLKVCFYFFFSFFRRPFLLVFLILCHFRMVQVRPQIPELTCLVQMNNSSLDGIDLPMEAFASTNIRIKQEPMTMHNSMLESNHGLKASTTQPMDLQNDAIEYIPNPLDDANIQGKLFVRHFHFYAILL